LEAKEHSKAIWPTCQSHSPLKYWRRECGKYCRPAAHRFGRRQGSSVAMRPPAVREARNFCAANSPLRGTGTNGSEPRKTEARRWRTRCATSGEGRRTPRQTESPRYLCIQQRPAESGPAAAQPTPVRITGVPLVIRFTLTGRRRGARRTGLSKPTARRGGRKIRRVGVARRPEALR